MSNIPKNQRHCYLILQFCDCVENYFWDIFSSISPSDAHIEVVTQAVDNYFSEEIRSRLEEPFTVSEVRKALFRSLMAFKLPSIRRTGICLVGIWLRYASVFLMVMPRWGIWMLRILCLFLRSKIGEVLLNIVQFYGLLTKNWIKLNYMLGYPFIYFLKITILVIWIKKKIQIVKNDSFVIFLI